MCNEIRLRNSLDYLNRKRLKNPFLRGTVDELNVRHIKCKYNYLLNTTLVTKILRNPFRTY